MSRAVTFVDVSDVAVSQKDQICVLDGCCIFIVDDNGILISSINYGIPLGSPTTDVHSLTSQCQPFALAVDPVGLCGVLNMIDNVQEDLYTNFGGFFKHYNRR